MRHATDVALEAQDCIHIINPMSNASGGSERHALRLRHDIGARYPVALWATSVPDPRFRDASIRIIDSRGGRFPRRGTFLFMGCYFNVGRWYLTTRPSRVILIHNVWNWRRLLRMRITLSLGGLRRVDLVHVSSWMRRAAGGSGIVHTPPIDPSDFVPATCGSDAPERHFRVGRLSRDVALKHHHEDPDLYRSLARAGCEISLMGGTCLRERLHDAEGIELLPACAIPAVAFLQSLDCFVFRTSTAWREPSGNVVYEAMSCGLPVVCHRDGGYAEHIDDGRDGFLFRTTEEAQGLVLQLKVDSGLREAVGRAARAKIVRLFSEPRRRAQVDWYAGPLPARRAFFRGS